MTSFDYLRNHRALVSAMVAYRPNRIFRAPLTAVSCACCVVLSFWIFEGQRLSYARTQEREISAVYRSQLPALRNANVYSARTKRLMRLDQGIRSIAVSATDIATEFAAIAKDLPGNVWLTEITPDSTGLLLEGRTSSFAALGTALQRLNQDALFKESTLSTAETIEKIKPAFALRFGVHLDT